VIVSVPDLISSLKSFHRHLLDDPALDPALIPTDLPHGPSMIDRGPGALIELGPGPDDGWRAPFAARDALVPVGRLRRIDGMVEFAREDQGNWPARCPVGQPDPPVYSDAADVWRTAQRGFVKVCDSLNHSLTTLCLQEAVMGSRCLAALETGLPSDRVLAIPVLPLWLDGDYVGGEPDHQFFASREHDVLVMNWAGAWVGSPIHEVTDLVAPGIGVHRMH